MDSDDDYDYEFFDDFYNEGDGDDVAALADNLAYGSCPSPVWELYDQNPHPSNLEESVSDWEYYSDDHYDGHIPDPLSTSPKSKEDATARRLTIMLNTQAVDEIVKDTKEIAPDPKTRKRSIPQNEEEVPEPKKARTRSKRSTPKRMSQKGSKASDVTEIDENRKLVDTGGVLRKVRYVDLTKKHQESLITSSLPPPTPNPRRTSSR